MERPYFKISFYPDERVQSTQNLFCLLLKRTYTYVKPWYTSEYPSLLPYEQGDNIQDTGLVLQRFGYDEPLFRRVGYFSDFGSNYGDDLDMLGVPNELGSFYDEPRIQETMKEITLFKEPGTMEEVEIV